MPEIIARLEEIVVVAEVAVRVRWACVLEGRGVKVLVHGVVPFAEVEFWMSAIFVAVEGGVVLAGDRMLAELEL